MTKRTLWYLLAGAGAGLLAGFLGIGGGVLLVPIMTAFLGLTQYRAHGTSLAIIVPVAAIGTLAYALRGDINWILVLMIGTGSLLGVAVGARLMMRIPPQRLRQLFGVYTIAVGILLILR